MATIHWTNGSGGAFGTAGNWNNGAGPVPGPSDTAAIDAAGTYTVTSSQNQEVSGLTTTSTVTLAVANNTSFTVDSSITNAGTIAVDSVGNGTSFAINGASVSLSGGGSVTLSDNVNNIIEGAAASDILTNVNNTISGAGALGNGQLTFVNQGTVDATGGNALVLNTGANAVTNAGLLEATGAGGLTISGTAVNSGTTGVIEANGGNVNLAGADIIGGTLKTAGGAAVETAPNDRGSILDGTTSTINNQGAVDVTNNAYLTIQGTLNNTGTINVQSVGNDTRLRIGAAGATLTGSGQVVLSDNVNNLIDSASATTLTNTNNTISGAGGIGGGSALTFVNSAAGVVNATGANALTIDSTKTVVNSGLLEATASGGLTILNTTINDTTGGTIEANGGSVSLAGADIVGGILLSKGSGGVVETAGSNRTSLLDGTTVGKPITILGQLAITNNAYLTIQGTINTAQTVSRVTTLGTLALQSGGNDTRLVIGAKGATINKGGTVTMTDNANNSIVGTFTQSGKPPHVTFRVSNLTNNAVISGAGSIGSELTLRNSGTIDATGGNALIIQTGDSRVANSSTVTNTGLIEATNPSNLGSTGGLRITSTTITGSKSVVEAKGANTHVDLQSATIQGGTLITSNGGVVETYSSDRGSVLDGTNVTAGAVNNKGIVDVTNNAYLSIQGSIANTGTINLQSGGNDTRLRIGSAGATLTGSGQIVLSDNANNAIDSAFAATLTNTNNTISGAGNLGDGTALTFVNQAGGTVNATGGNVLYIDSTSTVTNAGLLEATGSGGLNIFSTAVNGSTGGVIEANGGSVSLQSADIIGGTLKSPSGSVNVVDRGSVLDGTSSTVNNQAAVDILNNQYLQIQGTINNTGSINLQSGGNDTRLRIGTAGATLTGGGKVILSDNGNNAIDAVSTGTLTNSNNTISGAGNIGNGGPLVLVNSAGGTVDATGSTVLYIDSTSAVANAGLLEATGSGGLNIFGTTVNGSTGGTIEANGGNVSLQSADIAGGTLASPSGSINAVDRGSVLDGTSSAVNNQAAVDILNNEYLTVQGTLNNTGSISLQSNGNDTRLVIGSAGATLTGSGSVTMSNNGNNTIVASSGGATLTNSGNTISGAANLGGGSALTLVNGGTVDANQSGGTLTINASGGAVTNTGTLEATNGGTLLIDQNVTGSGGSAVIGTGSTVDFAGSFSQNASFTGSSGTLELAQSQSYTGTVSGLSTHGGSSGTVLDLVDIGFVNANEATFSGTSTGGTLSVTDGTHIAKIALLGNYLASTFVAQSDGHGGTIVFDPPAIGAGNLAVSHHA